MRQINGKLPKLKGISYGTLKNGLLSSSIIPIYFDGQLETGEFDEQAKLTFENMKHIIENAGGELTDIAQVIVYLKDIEDKEKMNKIWNVYFPDYFPNRATFEVNNFAIEGIAIELVVTAIIH